MEQTANTMPAAALGQYKGLAFTRRVRPVSEKAVEADIGNLARVHAPFVPTGAPAARGMRVTLDFEGFLEGAPIPDSRMEQVTVVLGTGQLMPAAEEAVYGHCAGETFRFDFTYPADFRVPELSGKTAQFEICLHTVERKQVPPVDDALAKSLGFADLEALRESLREKKRLSHEANADRIAGAALLDMAGANLTVELPAELLAQNAEYQMTQLRQRLRKSRMTMELYCKSAGLTPEQVREGYRREAERQLRAVLAVRAIAEAEQITVTQQEVDAEYARLSKLHDTPEEEIRKVLSRNLRRCANTEILPYALGTESKPIVMANDSARETGYFGTGQNFVNDAGGKADVEFTAQMRRGSELFGKLERLDFIKCDIEGYEVIVMREMRPLLERHRPTVLIETGGANRPQIVALFTGLGYTGYTLDRGREIPLTDDSSKDIIFRPGN